MSSQKKESFFWTSYSDLMTSIFFVMLVLFILSIVLLHNKMVDIENEKIASESQIKKINEIEEAVKNIDSTYFEYNSKYKKHIIKIESNFDKDQFEKSKIIPQSAIYDLVIAGKSIKDTIMSISKKYPEIQYLIIIEGQASKDNASDQHNYELSYKRAYTLKKIWDDNMIDFGPNCEILISGSGIGGSMRDSKEYLNQRFLIHLIPKPGIIEKSKSK